MNRRLIAALTLLSVFCACAQEAPPAARIRIGLSIPTQREERWVRDLQQLKEAAAAGNADLLVQVSENDAGRQLVQCEKLLAQNISVLIVAPHDALAASKIADKAALAGVKVISYDRLIMNAAVDLYVSFDNTKVGELQARYLSRLVPRGKYVVLAGAPTDNNATLLHYGAMRVLGPLARSGEIQIVLDQPVTDWDPEEAARLTANAITMNNGDIQAVLAPNDGTAGGVIRALSAYQLAGQVPVTGQDAEVSAARRVVEGSQAMTVFKDTRQLASAAFGAAMTMANGGKAPANSSVPNGKMDVPALLLNAVAVDKDNIAKVLIESGYLTRDQVYGKRTGAAAPGAGDMAAPGPL